jgi:hypothetical protein
MTDPHSQRTLLEELDARQDEVLDQLDELNLRVESVLKEWLGGRGDATLASKAAA